MTSCRSKKRMKYWIEPFIIQETVHNCTNQSRLMKRSVCKLWWLLQNTVHVIILLFYYLPFNIASDISAMNLMITVNLLLTDLTIKTIINQSYPLMTSIQWSCVIVHVWFPPLSPSGQLSNALLVPFSLHRWNSEPNLAHCSLARSSSQPHSSSSTTSSPSSVSQPGNHPFLRANVAPPPSAPVPLRRSESVGRAPLLRHTNPRSSIIPQRDSDYELEPERSRKRAIDNQYMLLWPHWVTRLHHLQQTAVSCEANTLTHTHAYDHAHIIQAHFVAPPSFTWVYETLREHMITADSWTWACKSLSDECAAVCISHRNTHSHSLGLCWVCVYQRQILTTSTPSPSVHSECILGVL